MDWLPWNLECSIGVSGPIVVYSNDDWLDLDPICIKVKFGSYAFVWEKVEIVNILETIIACEL